MPSGRVTAAPSRAGRFGGIPGAAPTSAGRVAMVERASETGIRSHHVVYVASFLGRAIAGRSAVRWTALDRAGPR